MAKLTTQFVKNIKPTKQINLYWDDLLKGFGLCVRPSGKKTFLLKYRIGRGRRAVIRKQAIGSHLVVSSEVARLKAKEWLLIASQGKDPCKVDNDQTSMKDFSKIYIHKYA